MLKLVQLSSTLMMRYKPPRVLWRSVFKQDVFLAAGFSERILTKKAIAQEEGVAPKKLGNYRDFVASAGRLAASGKRNASDSGDLKAEKQLTAEILTLLRNFPHIQLSDAGQHPDIQKLIERVLKEGVEAKTLDLYVLATEFLYNLNFKDNAVVKKWEDILADKVKGLDKEDKLPWTFALRRLLKDRNNLEIDSSSSKTNLVNSLRAVALYSINKKGSPRSEILSKGNQSSYSQILSQENISLAERIVLLLHRLSYDTNFEAKHLPEYMTEAFERFAGSSYHPADNTNILGILTLLEQYLEKDDSNPKLKDLVECYVEFLSKHHHQITRLTFEEIAIILERIGVKFRNSYSFEKLIESFLEATMSDSNDKVSPRNRALSRVLSIARKIGYSNVQQFERIENFFLIQYKKKYIKAADLVNSIRVLSDLHYEPQQLLSTLRKEANETIIQTEPRLLLPVFKSFASIGALSDLDQNAIQHVSNTLITLSTYRDAMILDRNIIGAYIQLRARLTTEQKKIFFQNVKSIAQKIEIKFLVLFLISVTQECGQHLPFEKDYIYLRALLESVVKQRHHELGLKSKKDYLGSSVGLLNTFGSQLYTNEITVVDVDECLKTYKDFTECKPGTLCLNTEFLNQFASAALSGKPESLELVRSQAESHEIASLLLLHLQDESALDQYLESEINNFVAGKGSLDTIYGVAKRKESIDQKLVEKIAKSSAVSSIVSKLRADANPDAREIQLSGTNKAAKQSRTHSYSSILYFTNLLWTHKLISRDTVIDFVKQFSRAVNQFNFKELLAFKRLVGESEMTQYIDNYPAFVDRIVHESHKANLTPTLAFQLLSTVPAGYFDENTTVRLEEMVIKSSAKSGGTQLFKLFKDTRLRYIEAPS